MGTQTLVLCHTPPQCAVWGGACVYIGCHSSDKRIALDALISYLPVTFPRPQAQIIQNFAFPDTTAYLRQTETMLVRKWVCFRGKNKYWAAEQWQGTISIFNSILNLFPKIYCTPCMHHIIPIFYIHTHTYIITSPLKH